MSLGVGFESLKPQPSPLCSLIPDFEVSSLLMLQMLVAMAPQGGWAAVAPDREWLSSSGTESQNQVSIV